MGRGRSAKAASAGTVRRHHNFRHLPVLHTEEELTEKFSEGFAGQRPCPTGKMGKCFSNAQRMAHTTSYGRLRYFEGCATPHSSEGNGQESHAHAWCVDEQGRVLDPTWKAPTATYSGVEVPLARLGWDAVKELSRYTDGSLFANYAYGDPLCRLAWPLSDESISYIRSILDNLDRLPRSRSERAAR